MFDAAAPDSRRRTARRGSGLRHWAIVGAAAAAVLGLAVVYAQTSPSSDLAQPLHGPKPLTTPSAPQPGTATLNLAEPFAGTPAAGWADGAAGIRPAAATAVGPYSAAQVLAAENAVRTTLIAGHLDPAMLVRHNDSTYLGTLAPNARAAERATLADSDTRDDSGGVSLLATGYSLLPAPIKVDGSMSVGTGVNGALTVHTNYVFAFPFRPADPALIERSQQIVALQHVTEDFDVPTGGNFAAGDHGVWPVKVDGYYDQMSCAASTLGYLAPAYSDGGSEGATGGDTPENPDSLYDPGHAVDITGNCPAGRSI